LGDARDVLAGAGLPAALPDGTDDPGVVRGEARDKGLLDRFVAAVAAHRVYARETDPPAV
jgi:catalase